MLIALIVFGVLIFVHEFGHYITARIFGVRVYEFSLGMGPKIISHTSKKTDIKYSVRLFPIGGYVKMAGEDEESDDPNSLGTKPAWKRFIIIAAGSIMNLLCGVLVMFMLVCAAKSLPTTTIRVFDSRYDVSSADSGLMQGDRILKVDGVKVHIGNELVYEIMRNGIEPIDITVKRNGEVITVPDVVFPTITDSGQKFGMTDFGLVSDETPGILTVLEHSYYRSVSTIKMIWQSLFDIITGRYGVEAVSGPIGVTGAIGEAAKESFPDLVYLSVVISMNLGIFNLLPLPALDGGRLVFILIEMIRRKPINPKYEGYVHFVGIILLLSLMVLVTFKDIAGLF